MKILIVHNNYGRPSGEEGVVEKMICMLQEHGYEVATYRKTTEKERYSLLGSIHGFFAGIFCISGIWGMWRAIRREHPDVVNVHNLFPFISPAALYVCRWMKVPVVMTIHNFRLICPNGLFMHNGMPCEMCLKKGSAWLCLKNRCEGSLSKSLGYTLRTVFARRIHAYDTVAAFACITSFQKQKLQIAHFPAHKLQVIPNFVTMQEKHKDCSSQNEGYIAYAGRLSKEKGIDMIVEVAEKYPDIPFLLAGELREGELQQKIPRNCKLTGFLTADKLEEFYKKAAFLVIPSRCYEGFPMAILETACYGKPCICPAHGGFTEIIGEGEEAIGVLFRPNDPDDLEQEIINLWSHPERIEELGRRAYEKVSREYSSEVVFGKWEKLINRISEKPIDKIINISK